jgi:signal transduction histidine kinase
MAILENGGMDAFEKKTGIIIEESGRLSRLIGNILTFSRKERAKLKLHPSRGSLDDVVRSTLAQYEPSLEAKGIKVALDLQTPGEVLLDGDAVGQIVGNLLSNVEKYCPPETPVSLATAQRDEELSLVIEDQGPGIPKSERERIFRPFYRISNELTDGVTGTGIGLAISRDLARLHGGDLELLPTEKGTCFRLTLKVQSIKEERES